MIIKIIKMLYQQSKVFNSTINAKNFQMALLLLADSQLERVWPNVKNNREAYRTGIFIPVKNHDQMLIGFQGIQSSVSSFFKSLGSGLLDVPVIQPGVYSISSLAVLALDSLGSANFLRYFKFYIAF